MGEFVRSFHSYLVTYSLAVRALFASFHRDGIAAAEWCSHSVAPMAVGVMEKALYSSYTRQAVGIFAVFDSNAKVRVIAEQVWRGQ